ncbi:MAG: HAD family hydrolase [Deltaproteobacteria bacterium]|nr:HAD family hydrolase [Deltaproteobacteria bacterium]
MRAMEESRETRRARIRGVVFDFDGTLTYPGALDFPAIKREMGCPPDVAILEYLETLSPEQRTPLERILEDREEEAAAESVPNEGAERCLISLKERGIRIGIITRNSLKSVHRALKGFTDIAPHDFDAIVTRENALPKPHPDGVCRAAREMGILPSELMVVGDFRFDIIAGKAAGACAVLLADSGTCVMREKDPMPDHRIRKLEEILDLV